MMSVFDNKVIDRMMQDARLLDCMDKHQISDPRVAYECTSHIRALAEEVCRLREIEADYTYVLNNLQWSNIGTGQGWIAKGIGGHTWTTAMQIRERRKADAAKASGTHPNGAVKGMPNNPEIYEVE